MILLQVDVTAAAGTASSILADRSDAMVILVGMIGLVALWVWKILIPQKASDQKLREADKEIHLANAATLQKLGEVTTGIHQVTIHSNTTLRAMVEVKDLEFDVMGKISQHTGCDVKEELAEMRGVMRAVRSGATTEK